MSRSRTAYREERQVGQGAYGSVFLAEDNVTRRKVALKRIDLNDKNGENCGVTITTLREISHLFKVQHENVVNLIEVVHGALPDRMREAVPWNILGCPPWLIYFACGPGACWRLVNLRGTSQRL